MKTLISFYSLRLPTYFVYMLQQVEYEPAKFLEWIQRLIKQNKKISSVMYRKPLHRTTKAKSLILISYIFLVSLIFLMGIFVFELPDFAGFYCLLIILMLPYFLIAMLAAVTYFARILIVRPREQKLVKLGREVFLNHRAVKIAVIGSYGKTSMKELLNTIFSEGLDVAMTPGNMNTSVSQARFAQKLKGNEEVLIVEFGEGEPGDVSTMTANLKPDYAVITGLAPNHLDKYDSLRGVAKDLLSVYDYLGDDQVFVSGESAMLGSFTPANAQLFNSKTVMGWKISKIVISVSETKFIMEKGKKSLRITTNLLGRHQVAPVAFGAALADKLGLTKEQIERACKKIVPFEHRMQARPLHGAWLIDDTYNGNLEGLQAGLRLLEELDMKRKWYVTPGLVDQGVENERVHTELGALIAKISPDIVVLMENSARPIIEHAMRANNFRGELRTESDPLHFYTNIEHLIVPGDLMLLQNDWTDNYN